LDGAGDFNYDIIKGDCCREVESIYSIDFDTNEKTLIKKRFWHQDYKINQRHFSISENLSVGWKFEIASKELGFDEYGGGKVMGLAQYANFKDQCPSEWKDKIDFANSIQINTEQQAFEIIKYAVDNSVHKDIIITGGYALNCVANTKYIEQFKDVEIHVDPICFDAGISIGSALYEFKNLDIPYQVSALDSIYLGPPKVYIDHSCELHNLILDLLLNQEIVAIFQGRSEAGQRALGNRSLIFDPRIKSGKDTVNRIKLRENFRPFAASVLEEDAKDWFDLCGLDRSPYMMYTFTCKKPNLVPAVVHVDGTSRIQTINKNQNKNFYNLIKTFKNATGIPMLLNTSFNYAGEPLVESLEDAISSCKKMQIKYLLDTDKIILL
jgi:carbamoyltransferase